MHSTTKYNSVNKATNGVHSTLVYKKSVFCTLFLIAHQWCAVKLVCKCHLKVCYAHLISKSVWYGCCGRIMETRILQYSPLYNWSLDNTLNKNPEQSLVWLLISFIPRLSIWGNQLQLYECFHFPPDLHHEDFYWHQFNAFRVVRHCSFRGCHWLH